MINKVILIGRLTKDPEQKILPSGSKVAELSLAYNRSYKDKNTNEWKEEPHFFDIKAYGMLADRIITQVSKGYMIYVEGRLVQERWQKDGKTQSKVSIFAENIKVVSRPQGKTDLTASASSEEHANGLDDIKADIENIINEEDDDVPF